ncbi:MAG TPA: YihY/virulence factor BrkB family protein [Blastocatellia bacterium]|nr:YihY/virulence factor BrkB family protein [Blastocatellia bacterium]
MATTVSDLAQPEHGAGFYLRGVWLFFKRMWPAIYDLSTAEAYVYASAVAFNALLSFFAFLVLIGNVLENWARWHEGYETAYRLMMAIAPAEAGSVIRALDSVTRNLGKSASLYSTFALIFTSSGVLMPLELALNRAWGIKQVRSTIKQQLVYLPLVITCAAVILCFVALASVWDQALAKILPFEAAHKLVFNSTSAIFAAPCITLVFFLIYYWLPNGKVQTSRVFFTSAAMAVLWVLMTFAYRLLLPILNFRLRYGRDLFAIVTVITWFFISSFILLLGANLSAREILPRRFTDEEQVRTPVQPDEFGTRVVVEK